MVAIVATLSFAAAARAEGVDETCQLTASRFDADTLNVLYPDSSAQYWSFGYTAVPGTRIRIDGIFPYARYTSWNVYDPLLRPFAKKTDFELQPEPGSSNPFLPGVDRTTPISQRRYTVFITFDPSDNPGPNTIYVDPSAHPEGLATLRVYVPDRGLDATGGAGLPQVTWEPTSSSGPSPTSSPCQTVEKPSSDTLTQAYAEFAGPDTGPPYPGRNPPDWHKFVNLCQSGADLLFDNGTIGQITNIAPGSCTGFGSGGFLSNLDNAYAYTFITRGFGPIVAFHGKAPTFANTYPNTPIMPSGVQLRYWSFCQNEPISQRYVACARDDQVAVDGNGNYTIVIAQPTDWPSAATQQCRGVATLIPWGPQADGVVIYRQMLPDPSFTQAIQNVSHGTEQQQMGPYYPAGQYFTDWHAVAKTYCRG